MHFLYCIELNRKKFLEMKHFEEEGEGETSKGNLLGLLDN